LEVDFGKEQIMQVLVNIRRAVLGLASALALASTAGAQDLPALNLDQDATTVSGLSSGGFKSRKAVNAYSA
jgi:hypothetical protein